MGSVRGWGALEVGSRGGAHMQALGTGDVVAR